MRLESAFRLLAILAKRHFATKEPALILFNNASALIQTNPRVLLFSAPNATNRHGNASTVRKLIAKNMIWDFLAVEVAASVGAVICCDSVRFKRLKYDRQAMLEQEIVTMFRYI